MTNTSVKPRIKSKSGSALRYEVRALRAASGERSKSQTGSTAALTPLALLRGADGTIYEPAYWAFIKGFSEASPEPEFEPHCGDAQCQEQAEQLLVLVPERLTAREKGFLFGIFKWRGPGAIPLEHRRKVDQLYQALNDLDETS